jgi:hypothetical protein
MTTIPFLDEPRLVALIKDPTTTAHGWADRGACTNLLLTGDPYFPEDGRVPPVEALECCASCPVAQECLASALVHEAVDSYRFGWWGGLGPAERELLWSRLEMPAGAPAEIDLRDPASIARHLRAQRRSISAIAAELGCTERTIYRYLAAAAA